MCGHFNCTHNTCKNIWLPLGYLMLEGFSFCSGFQEAEATEEEKKSKNVLKKIAKRLEGQKLDSHLEDQFASGRLLACISSRPGQCGRSDGYVQISL